MSNENRLTYLGNRIVEKVEEFVDRAYSAAVKGFKVEVNVPKGFVRASNQTSDDVPKSADQSDTFRKILSTILPAGMAFVGWQFDSSVATLVLAGVGGLVGQMIPFPVQEKTTKSAEPTPQPLRREDIKFRPVVDDSAKLAFLSEVRDEILKLGLDISDFETKAKSKNDIGLNQNFGEWAQRFIMYAHASPDKRLQRICDAFINQLETMDITVYDELILNSEGKPDVPSPFRDYLFDARQGQEFTKVERPAIYSDRQVLAKGKVS